MKIRKVSRRGTEIHDQDVKSQNWAGDSYREFQQNQLHNVPKNTTLNLGRGVRTTTIGDLEDPKPRPSTERMTRITNRGTSSRPSTNKGSQKNFSHQNNHCESG